MARSYEISSCHLHVRFFERTRGMEPARDLARAEARSHAGTPFLVVDEATDEPVYRVTCDPVSGRLRAWGRR